MIYDKNLFINVAKDFGNIEEPLELSDEFFNKFDFPKDKVMQLVNILPLRDKVLLVKRFGKSSVNVTSYEQTFINETIIHKLRLHLSALGKTEEFVYIDYYFNEDIDLLLNVSKKCGIYSYLSDRFGEDFRSPMIVSSNYKDKAVSMYVKNKMNSEIRRFKGINKIELIKPFHEKFIQFKRSDESYEDFVLRVNKNVYAHLNETLLMEVHRTYNQDLLNIISYGQYEKGMEHSTNLLKAYNIVKKYLLLENQKYYTQRHYSSLDNLLREDVSLDELLEELSKINSRTISLAKLKYGENYDDPSVVGTLSKSENKYLTDAISVARKRVLKKKGK